ncbi:MAG TPA: class I SAM-dependent methyltransferase [Ktedonosporobacter sp.]|nr:class I SAM-dependent methyltransferase [Ktedonosporobacter sp.]
MSTNLYVSGDYLKKNPIWHVDESPWKATEILRIMARNRLAPKTICEVGCGAGEILRRLQASLDGECVFSGYDISPQAIELAKERENDRLHFQLGDVTQEQNAFFDLILVMDVLEHMEDYFTFLRTIREKSRYKIFHLPMDISIRSIITGELPAYRETYGHIHYFTRELALQMVKEQGYEVLDYFYTEKFVERPRETNKTNALLRLKKSLGRRKRELLKLPQKLVFAANQDVAVRLFGGWRLIILAR